ncbi:MAG TPA: glycosyl hydrolase 115 family protein, partial [Opitutaceae bacterium]|nr:glycosyl hydrolase 115 family protein [Opitutaceae bacterium]
MTRHHLGSQASFALCALLAVRSAPAQTPPTPSFPWVSDGAAAAIVVAPGENAAVARAAVDLRRDVGTVTGVETEHPQAEGRILILSADNDALDAALKTWSISRNEIPAEPESFRIEVTPRGIDVLGADELGAIYGVYYLSQTYLGIDPLKLWGALPPKHRDRVSLPIESHLEAAPRFRWRGWFINDEDLLTGWHPQPAARPLVHYYFSHPIALDVYQRIFETALRLRCNFIIPGSYIDLTDDADRKIVSAAVARGLYVSQHHTQPLGVSAFAFRNYWNTRHGDVAFSYAQNPEAFRTVWSHYAALWKACAGDHVIWQLGLRGTGDRSFWSDDPAAPKDNRGRGAMISQAVQTEWNIIAQGSSSPPICTTTLWAEGSDLNREGYIHLPSGVIMVFANNGATQEFQEDFFNTPREKGRLYGAYTHAAFWGAGPHLIQSASLLRLAKNFRLMLANHTSAYSVQNVSNIREFLLTIEAAAHWTASSEPVDAEGFLRAWCTRIYGPAAADACAALYLKIPEAYPPHPYIKLPSRRLLDGDIRAEGKRLLSQALDRDFYSSSVVTDTIPPGVKDAIAVVSSRFHQLAREGAALESSIPADRRRFFEDNVMVQLKMQRDMADWAAAVCDSIGHFGAAEVSGAARDMDRA